MCVYLSCTAGDLFRRGGSRLLIGRRASGGGSEGHTDGARVSGAVDISAGGIWIAYIKQALGASQLLIAAPVTGSGLFCSAIGTSLGLLIFL